MKPAWEPVILAMKPLDGTFAENALAHGVAGLNVDGGRVGLDGERPPAGGTDSRTPSPSVNESGYGVEGASTKSQTPTSGRWPANVILDEEAGALLDQQAGVSSDGVAVNRNRGERKPSAVPYVSKRANGPDVGYGGSGGPSRFFYTAKASSGERGDENRHPTVKPVDLTAYLAKLLLPPEQDEPRRILVPFSGSGSEVIGAFRAGWEEATAIEIDPDYCELAHRRIEGDAPLLNRVETI